MCVSLAVVGPPALYDLKISRQVSVRHSNREHWRKNTHTEREAKKDPIAFCVKQTFPSSYSKINSPKDYLTIAPGESVRRERTNGETIMLQWYPNRAISFTWM